MIRVAKIVGIKRAAELYKCSETTVRRWMRKQKQENK